MKLLIKCILAAGVMASLSACQSVEESATQRLADQSVMAVNWMQQSGEYQAITLQTFYFATQAFDRSTHATTLPRAVVVDLDETMIDNSAYQAWAAQQRVAFTDKTWSQWTQSEQALAIPGAVDFARYVNSHGGKIFYVSNRSTSDFNATARNLNALGFPGVDKQTLLLNQGSSNKQARFDQINAAGYRIVLYVGDNLNDFGGAAWHQNNQARRQFVAKHRQEFGTQFIILPNPTYGDWESGLVDNYNKLSPQEKIRSRDHALRAWQPTTNTQ